MSIEWIVSKVDELGPVDAPIPPPSLSVTFQGF